jgi:hypothetical protein
LGIDRELSLAGGGDTSIQYIVFLMFVTLAAVAALVWSGVDRREHDYSRAARWLELGVCVHLGVTMFSYGTVKLIPVQMPAPGPGTLVTPFGEFGRMGVLWSFMGVSPGYQSVVGALEVLGGLLLFWRRTRLLGAALVTVVMTNVVLMNFFYAVPVKLFATQLLCMALGLLLLDAPRLLAVFVFNQPARAADLSPMFPSRRGRLASEGLKLVFLVWVLGQDLSDAAERLRNDTLQRAHVLWGAHDVESFTRDGELLAPLKTDDTRWDLLIVSSPEAIPDAGIRRGWVSVETMTGSMTTYQIDFDEDTGTLDLLEDFDEVGTLHYSEVDAAVWMLTGEFEGAHVEIRLRRRALETTPLNDSFRWSFG